MKVSLVTQVGWLFQSFLYALRFYLKNPIYIVFFIFYSLFIFVVMGFSLWKVVPLLWPKDWSYLLAAQIGFLFLGLYFCTLIFVPIVNIVMSTLHGDGISIKIYNNITKLSLVEFKMNEKGYWKNILFEILKVCILVFSGFLVILSFALPFLSPFLILFSAWFLGFDALDRSLGLLRYSFKERFAYGKKLLWGNLGMGLLCFIPFVNLVVAFWFPVYASYMIGKYHEEEKKYLNS